MISESGSFSQWVRYYFLSDEAPTELKINNQTDLESKQLVSIRKEGELVDLYSCIDNFT